MEQARVANLFGLERAYLEENWVEGPRDIDVLVVGSASLSSVRRACRPLEGELRLEINPVIVTVDEWSAPAPTPFLAQLRSQPIVEVPLARDE